MSAARTSARVVLLDDDGAVLLFCGSDPAITDGTAPRWWFTVGGQNLPGNPWRTPRHGSWPRRPDSRWRPGRWSGRSGAASR